MSESTTRREIHRAPVTSSNIVSIGHDPARNVLHVEFKSGKVYEYRDITAGEHKSLINAESVGSHFARMIKPYYQGTPI